MILLLLLLSPICSWIAAFEIMALSLGIMESRPSTASADCDGFADTGTFTEVVARTSSGRKDHSPKKVVKSLERIATSKSFRLGNAELFPLFASPSD